MGRRGEAGKMRETCLSDGWREGGGEAGGEDEDDEWQLRTPERYLGGLSSKVRGAGETAVATFPDG